MLIVVFYRRVEIHATRCDTIRYEMEYLQCAISIYDAPYRRLRHKPKVHMNILQRLQSRTKPRPQATYVWAYKYFVKFRRVVFELREWTDRARERESRPILMTMLIDLRELLRQSYAC